MNREAAFRRALRELGQEVEIYREGTLLGRGQAILQPIHHREEGFLPTDLGILRREPLLCFAQASLPLAPQWGETELRRGCDRFRVVNVRSVEVKGRRIFWRAVLAWRGEGTA